MVTSIVIDDLPHIGRDIRGIEEPAKIFGASSGASHGKDAECNWGGSRRVKSAAGGSDVPYVPDILHQVRTSNGRQMVTLLVVVEHNYTSIRRLGT